MSNFQSVAAMAAIAATIPTPLLSEYGGRCYIQYTVQPLESGHARYWEISDAPIVEIPRFWTSVWYCVKITIFRNYSKRTKVFVHRQISMYRLCHLSTKESVGNQDGN